MLCIQFSPIITSLPGNEYCWNIPRNTTNIWKLKKNQKKPVPNSLQPLLQVPTTSKNHFKQRFTYRVAGNTSRVTKPINQQATQHIWLILKHCVNLQCLIKDLCHSNTNKTFRFLSTCCTLFVLKLIPKAY